MDETLRSVAVVTAIGFLLDQAWFSLTLQSIYTPAIVAVTGTDPIFSWLPAGLSWVSISALVVLLERLCPRTARLPYSAMIGGLVYSIYNTTVKALFVNYSWPAVILDIMWGSFLVAVLFRVSTVAARVDVWKRAKVSEGRE